MFFQLNYCPITILISLFYWIFPISNANCAIGPIRKDLDTTAVIFNRIFVNNAAEIKIAMQSAKPGDTLFMRNRIWMNQQIVFEGNGTAQTPIILMAETPGKVILSGQSSLHIAGSYLEVNGLVFKNGYLLKGDVIEFKNKEKVARHCRLTNTIVSNYNSHSDTLENHWVSLYGTYNRVDHSLFQGKNNDGTTLVVWLNGHPDYHRVDHNHFGPRPPLGRNGGEIIRVGTSTWSQTDSYTTVDDNYFEKCDGETEIISNKSCHNTYRHNTFYKCRGTLTLRHGNYALVEGNFFFGENEPGTGGIRIIGSHHVVINNYLQDITGTDLHAPISVMSAQEHPKLTGYWRVDSAVIANNTIVNCMQGIVFGSGAGERGRVVTPTNCFIYNNIIYSKKGQPVIYKATPVNIRYAANIFYGRKPAIILPGGIQFINPYLKFNGYNDSLWRPVDEDKIIINKGVQPPDFVIKEDMDEQRRDDGKIDIGADEWSAMPVTRPVNRQNTGPAWIR